MSSYVLPSLSRTTPCYTTSQLTSYHLTSYHLTTPHYSTPHLLTLHTPYYIIQGYTVLFKGRNGQCAHEFILDLRPFKQHGTSPLLPPSFLTVTHLVIVTLPLNLNLTPSLNHFLLLCCSLPLSHLFITLSHYH